MLYWNFWNESNFSARFNICNSYLVRDALKSVEKMQIQDNCADFLCNKNSRYIARCKHLTKFYWVNWYMALYVSLGGSNGCQICCMHLLLLLPPVPLPCQPNSKAFSFFFLYSILWWLFCSVRRKTKYCNWMPTILLVGKTNNRNSSRAALRWYHLLICHMFKDLKNYVFRSQFYLTQH